MKGNGKKSIELLSPYALSPEADKLKKKLAKRIIGQEYAVNKITSSYQIFQAGLANPDKPISSFLFLGPTGTGKTKIVEALAEIFFNKSTNILKVDCAEFSHSHEIARLIGSPPGYLGHNETPPYFTQRNIDKYQTEEHPFTLILFDEIEKANSSLWQLLLGVLDKGRLTLGNNKVVDLSRSFIFMTSNVGSKSIEDMIAPSIGFQPEVEEDENIQAHLRKLVLGEAKKTFTPEFLNRIDHKLVFHNLTETQIGGILDLELVYIQERLEINSVPFKFKVTAAVRKFLITKGFNKAYGGRPLKRSLEKYLIFPLAGLIASKQIKINDVVIVDFSETEKRLVFTKEPVIASACASA